MANTLMQPGLYPTMTNAEYQAADAISNSRLAYADEARAPIHYWAKYVDPARKPEKRAPALIVGDAIHTACLEPDQFEDRFIERPDGINGATKEGKLSRAELSARAAGRQILRADEYETVRGCRDAISRHPVAAGLIR